MRAIRLLPHQSLGGYLIHSTLVVSGYPPMKCIGLEDGGGHTLAKSLSAEDITAYARRLHHISHAESPSRIARCAGCRRWVSRDTLFNFRLGYDGYCCDCVRLYAAECKAKHGRLPRRREFYCLGCTQIRREGHLTPPDADGRRRWRCRKCRAVQMARADQRRKKRDASAERRSSSRVDLFSRNRAD